MRRLAAFALIFVSSRAFADEPPEDVFAGGTPAQKMGGSVYVVKKDQLDRFKFDNAEKVMLQIPGVYVRTEDGMGLRPNIGMRGVNADRSKKITLTEDGVLFGPAPYSAPAAYYFPLITRMEAVRALKGPAALAFGPQTVGGAVDFVTKDIPTTLAGTADLAFGQYAYRKVHVTFGGSTEQFGFLIEGLNLGNDGFKQLDGGGDTGAIKNEWMVKTRFIPDPNDRAGNQIDLKLGYSDEASNETYTGLTDADLRATPMRRYVASKEDHMQWHRTQVEATWRVRPLPDLDAKTTVYRHDFARVWRKLNQFAGADLYDVLANPSPRNEKYYKILTGAQDSVTPDETLLIGPNNRTFVAQGVQTVLRWSPKTGPLSHKWEYGMRFHYDEIVRKHSQDGFLMKSGALVPDGGTTQVTADNTASANAIAIHILDAVSYKLTTLTPGLRVESILGRFDDRLANVRTSSYHLLVLPGIGGYVGLTKEVGLLAGVHRGMSPPPPDDPSSKPEDSINYEWGARVSAKRFRAELVGYYNDYSNITSICTFSSGCDPKNLDKQLNGGKARIFGFETLVEASPRIAKVNAGALTKGGVSFPMRAAYTLTQSAFLQTFESGDPTWGLVHAGDEIPYVPMHQLSASIGVETRMAGLSIMGTYLGDMREKPGQGDVTQSELTDAYFELDASAYYSPIKNVSFYLNGRNLTNTAPIVSRRPYGARPIAPLWFQLGVRLSF